jgi:hypothetical protein
MQLYEILCVSETNSVAILLYMISACVRVRYHCGELVLCTDWFRRATWGRDPDNARSPPINLR